MTSEMNFDDQILGVLVTGRLGHRGSDTNSFFTLLMVIRQVFPLAEISFSTSAEPGPEIRRRLDSLGCKVAVSAFSGDPSLTYGMNSLVRQTEQVQLGLEIFSSKVQHVMRIRSDWLVTNQANSKEFVAGYLEAPLLTFLDVNWPRLPWMPIPWQGNDYLTLGDVQSVSRFWARFENSEIHANKKTRTIFSRQFHYYPECNVKSVEQMLFRRYFGTLLKVNLKGNFLSELDSWFTAEQFMKIIPYQSAGVSPPAGALSSSRIAKFFFGLRAKSEKRSTYALQLATSFLIGAMFFWLHPMWVWSRIKFVTESVS